LSKALCHILGPDLHGFERTIHPLERRKVGTVQREQNLEYLLPKMADLRIKGCRVISANEDGQLACIKCRSVLTNVPHS
jgi:hypothetical protein